MSGSITLPVGGELCHLPACLELEHGGALAGATLAFERQGPCDAPVVLALGGISSHRHVSAHAGSPRAGWWEGFVGDGGPVDTRRFAVLSIDWLGGVGGSTGPRSGERLPAISTRDQAVAIVHLLDQLGIERLHAVIGSSYGGMVGQQLAALAPHRVDRLCSIAAAHESHPLASAWRSVQRQLVELGLRHGHAQQSLALARQLAMTTYRTPREFGERFAAGASFGPDGAVHADVHGYLQAHGDTFCTHMTPESFLALCASIDAHRVRPDAVLTPTWVVGFDSDQLVPVGQVVEFAGALPARRGCHVLPSRFGHDAFLKERAALAPILAEVLS